MELNCGRLSTFVDCEWLVRCKDKSSDEWWACNERSERVDRSMSSSSSTLKLIRLNEHNYALILRKGSYSAEILTV